MELQEPSPNNNNNNGNNPTHQILDLNEAVLTPENSPPYFVLSFTNLTYSVKTTEKFKIPLFSRQKNEDKSPDTKVLLNEISGEAREGEIMAVLGASGSGKSTLIDALAARISKESLRGTVTLNGDVLESKLLKILSAYVMQDDLLFPMLTVEETLMFSAEFRLPRSMTSSKKKARVQALIDQLGLRSAAKTVIGDEGHRGVSGGERRRVSIGIDIIHDPILLYLDEPTSGLDSSSAFMVVKVLKRIAQSGSIVIASLHQPSYRVMNLLDQLMFLSRGQAVFCGPPATLSPYFVQFGHPIPNNENPTEFTLDLIRELEVSANGIKLLAEFNKAWQRRNNYDNALNSNISIMRLPLKKAVNVDMNTENSDPRFANSFWTDVLVISKRSLKNSWRMPELYGVRVVATVITSIILATIYWKLDDSPRGVQERIAFFAFAMTSIFYTCAESIPIFLQERYIFMRETAYNTYRRSSYVLAHAIVTIPSLLFLSFLFAVITFWCIGLSGGFSGFLYYFLLIAASFWAGSSFVTFLSGVVANVMLAYTVVVAMLAYFLLFSGFFINRDRIPWYWLWFHYVSLVKYSYEGVLQNEFGSATKCFAKGIQIFDNSPLATVSDSMKLKLLKDMSKSLGTNITGSTCLSTGLDILNQQVVTDISKWNCLWITVAWGFFFRILFYFSLLLGSKNKRR